MKNLLMLAVILGISIAYAPLTMALSQVQEYSLRVGETIKIENYLNTEISLKSLGGVSVLSYPSQTRLLATIRVHTEGGCGPKNPGSPVPMPARESNTDFSTPRCLGMPSFENEYNVSEGQTVMVLGLKITAISITNDMLKIHVTVPGREPIPTPIIEPTPFPCPTTPGVLQSSKARPCPVTPTPTPTCLPRPACLDSTPRCLIAEPATGWCQRVLPTPIPIQGVTGGGLMTICPSGSFNCTVCSGTQCYPKTVEGRQTGQTPPPTEPVILRLPKNQEIQEVNRIEVNGNNSVYKVKTTRKARLLFLLPVHLETAYSVNSETGVAVKINQSWWNFLAR